MTKLLTITASPDAPVACDMTGANDTLAERLAEYRRLFDHALVTRDSADHTTTFRFAARPGVADWVLDLVRRESACCPFLSYEVDQDDEQILWTTRGLGATDMAILDDFLVRPDPGRLLERHRPAAPGPRRHPRDGAHGLIGTARGAEINRSPLAGFSSVAAGAR